MFTPTAIFAKSAAAPGVEYTVATGGSISIDQNYKIHTFTTSGTFNITAIGTVDSTFNILLVGGGGGGGVQAGGGGGGGGVLSNTGASLAVGSRTITVGLGGAGGVLTPSRTTGGNGGNTSIDATYVAIGGGGGGSLLVNNPGNGDGSNGGSGGGGQSGAPGTGGTGTAGQGFAGGNGVGGGVAAGGGGGAGQAGGNGGATPANGYGGDGVSNSITGVAVTYGGGGGGGNDSFPGGNGGAGGGGIGGSSSVNGGNGTNGLGGGGGGMTGFNNALAGDGGDGVAIIRYRYTEYGLPVDTPNLWLDGDNSNSVQSTTNNATWYDLSGNGFDANATGSTASPIAYTGSVDTNSDGHWGYPGGVSSGGNYVGKFHYIADDASWDNNSFTIQMWVRYRAFESAWYVNSLMAHDPGGGANPKWFFSTVDVGGSQGEPIWYVESPGFGNYTLQDDVTTNLNLNTWYNLALTKNGTSYQWYVNGSATKSGTNSIVIPNVNKELHIGMGEASGANTFRGDIGQVLHYTSALPGTDILENYNRFKSRYL